MPRPSSGDDVRSTSPAFSILVTVWVTRLRLWASAPASWAIRIWRSGRSERRTKISYSVSDRPKSCWRSASSRSTSNVMPTTNARHDACWSASSQRVPRRSDMTEAYEKAPDSVDSPARRRVSRGGTLPQAGSAQALQDQRHALAPPDAHGDQAGGLVVPVQGVEHRVLQPGTGHPEGMADRDGAAVHVEPVEVDPEVLVRRHDLGRERLVDLNQVDVADGHARTGECPLGRLDRTEPHDLGREGAHAGRHDPGQGSDAELGRLRVGHDDDRCRAVVQRAAVARGDHAVGAEDGLEL